MPISSEGHALRSDQSKGEDEWFVEHSHTAFVVVEEQFVG
jgi:hypothetical protein